MKIKKGIQLNQAFSAVLIITLVAVLIIIAIYMFTALNSSIPSKSNSVTNETGYVNSTGYNLVYYNVAGFSNPALVTLYNLTSGKSITLANATVSLNGTITNATSINWNNVSISYTYSSQSSAQASTMSMVAIFGGYPALIGLVGTIIFLGLVIGVLIASFAFGGKKGV